MDSEKIGKLIRETSIVILALIVVVALVLFFKKNNQTRQVQQVPRQPELSQQELLDKLSNPTPNLNPKISPTLIKSLSSSAKK